MGTFDLTVVVINVVLGVIRWICPKIAMIEHNVCGLNYHILLLL